MHDFVAESLETPLPFVLYETSTRLEQSDYDKLLVDMKLAPSALLTFNWHPDVAAEIQAQMGERPVFLKPDIMALASPL